MAELSKIVKSLSKGLMEGFEDLGEKEAIKAAEKITSNADKKVLGVMEKNMENFGRIIKTDIKDNTKRIANSMFPEAEYGIKEYMKGNSFQNLQSVENAVERIDYKNNIIDKIASKNKKIMNKDGVKEIYESLEDNLDFSLNVNKDNIIQNKIYNNRAASDEVFKGYLDNYKNVKGSLQNLEYEVDETTKKEMLGDKIRRDYASNTKEYKQFIKDHKSGNMNEPINQRIDTLINSSDSLEDMFHNAYMSDKDFNIRQAASRAENTSSATMDEAINKKKHQTFEEYTKNKYDKQFEDSWNKYENASAEEKTKMNSKFGIDEEENAKEKMKEHFDKAREGGGTFGVGDKMAYYKVPQKAVGIGATAWMVSNMFGSRGQMDNQQLYGQQQPYNGNPQY